MGRKPKILLVGLEHFGTARLPRELQAAGFLVGMVCRDQSLLAKTKFFDVRFQFGRQSHGRGLLATIRGVILAWQPDWVLPMDDRTALFLAQVARWSRTRSDERMLADLLERSLGNPDALGEVLDKGRATKLAAQLGLRVPPTQIVETPDDISHFSMQHGLPVVVKRCFSHGGKDVHICQDQAQAQAAFNGLAGRDSLYERLLMWRKIIRGRILSPRWLPASRAVMISKYIPGRPAMLQAVAVAGRMHGALAARVEETFPHMVSPASVVRFIRHEEMRRTAERLIAHWKLSGFVAFDFILDDVGQAWFLECNPRPIPISHLGAPIGENLCRRFYSQLTGEPMPPEKPFTEMTVAHFPKEQRRDPQSLWLKNALHDVPVDDPDLVAALLAEFAG